MSLFSGATNPYDEIVEKTTDENLTSENWELILNLCDKVTDEGPAGAKNVIAAVLKRLAHRNSNVQLYALSLAEALSKNCTIELHREIASKSFTLGLENIVTARTTHEKVKQRALTLVAMWTAEFEKDSTLGIMEDCYNNLKAKGFKFEAPQEAPPPTVDDEIRRKEEEELQRVLEMSIQDKGGRSNWQSGYSPAAAAAASSSSGSGGGSSSTAARAFAAPTYAAGYSPAPPRSPSPRMSAAQPAPAAAPAPSSAAGVVTRVRALHTFTPTEAGELAFDKGDVIKVVDRGYKDWWRGQLKGRTGIFPVNYVEPLPEPTAAELAKEAEREADVFAQAANVDKLLTLLKGLDPTKDSLADNEEIQELYRSSMVLRPKIVKLIDKYRQKQSDLVSMNDTFARARIIFERMMEDSLARYEGPPYAQGQQRPYPGQQSQGYPRPDSRGWNPNQGGPVYPAQQQQHPSQQGHPQGGPGYGNQQPPQQQQAVAYGASPYAQASPEPQPYGASPYPQGPAGATTPPQGGAPQPGSAPVHQQQPQAQGPPPQQQQAAAAAPPSTQNGPPYLYDPNGTYQDPNVQAWAAYYAQGGKELAGAVYFVAIPGVTDGAQSPPPPHAQAQAQGGGSGSPTQVAGGEQPSAQSPIHGEQPSHQASVHHVNGEQPPPLQSQPSYQASVYPSSSEQHQPPLHSQQSYQASVYPNDNQQPSFPNPSSPMSAAGFSAPWNAPQQLPYPGGGGATPYGGAQHVGSATSLGGGEQAYGGPQRQDSLRLPLPYPGDAPASGQHA